MPPVRVRSERYDQLPATTAMLDLDGMAINNSSFVRKLIESISGALQIACHITLYPLLRGWRRRWGTTEEDRALRLPGDERASAAELMRVHRIMPR